MFALLVCMCVHPNLALAVCRFKCGKFAVVCTVQNTLTIQLSVLFHCEFFGVSIGAHRAA